MLHADCLKLVVDNNNALLHDSIAPCNLHATLKFGNDICSFLFSLNKYYRKKLYVVLSGIRTRIIGIEDDH